MSRGNKYQWLPQGHLTLQEIPTVHIHIAHKGQLVVGFSVSDMCQRDINAPPAARSDSLTLHVTVYQLNYLSRSKAVLGGQRESAAWDKGEKADIPEVGRKKSWIKHGLIIHNNEECGLDLLLFGVMRLSRLWL